MIQRAQVRADIDQHQIGADVLARRPQNTPHTTEHPKCARLAIQAIGPLAGKFVLGRRQRQVAGHQA